MEYWLTGIGTFLMAIATVALAVVAVFQDKIRERITRPELEVSIEPNPPDCLSIPMVMVGPQGEQLVKSDCYYIRLRIENTGNQKAESPEVFASELSKRQADGEFRRVASFLPMNLIWADFRAELAPAIPPKMYRHCDIAHVLDPERRGQFPQEDNIWNGVPANTPILSFDTFVKPNTLSHLVPFGTYRLLLLIAAANAKPITRTLEISLTGDWFSDESSMLGDGLGVRIV